MFFAFLPARFFGVGAAGTSTGSRLCERVARVALVAVPVAAASWLCREDGRAEEIFAIVLESFLPPEEQLRTAAPMI